METLQKIIYNSIYGDYAIRNNYTMKADYTNNWFDVIDNLLNKAKEQLSSNEVETLQNLIYSSDEESQQLAKNIIETMTKETINDSDFRMYRTWVWLHHYMVVDNYAKNMWYAPYNQVMSVNYE